MSEKYVSKPNSIIMSKHGLTSIQSKVLYSMLYEFKNIQEVREYFTAVNSNVEISKSDFQTLTIQLAKKEYNIPCSDLVRDFDKNRGGSL